MMNVNDSMPNTGSGQFAGTQSGAGYYPGMGDFSQGFPQYAPQTMPGFPGQGFPQGYMQGFPQSFPQTAPPAGAFPGFSTAGPGIGGTPVSPAVQGQLPVEQSYIENILRLNLGKMVTLYMTYENNSQWNAKVFRGILEAAGRDHIVISDPKTGMRFLLLMINLDYATFDEELNYSYPIR